MRITAAVAEQLLLLHGDPDRGDNFVAALSRLGRDVAVAVPSCLAVTITLAAARGRDQRQHAPLRRPRCWPHWPYRCPRSRSGGLLILRAGEAGAFLLLADDLDGLLGPGHPPIDLDEHLAWPAAANAESLGASLADLSVVDQAIGVLVDRGLPPEAAHRELWRRVGEGDTTIADVSRALLASPRSDPGHS